MIKIRVPATSANVGCGFDCLGLALSLYTTFTFEKIDKGLEWVGCEKSYQNENNLIYTSFKDTLLYLNKEVPPVRISIDCDVPISRGLGSSSTCVVGGIFAAYEISDTAIDLETILKLATKIEGHPDNVAPAIYGGLCASCMAEDKVITQHYDIDKRFKMLALIPDFKTKTKDARAVLPNKIPFKDAIYSLSRLGIILKAFENYDLSVLKDAMDDAIHEPYRKKLIHEYEEVKIICEEIDSVCFFISGSGSTLINIIEDESNMDKIKLKLNSLNYNWKTCLLQVDNEGTKVL